MGTFACPLDELPQEQVKRLALTPVHTCANPRSTWPSATKRRVTWTCTMSWTQGITAQWHRGPGISRKLSRVMCLPVILGSTLTSSSIHGGAPLLALPRGPIGGFSRQCEWGLHPIGPPPAVLIVLAVGNYSSQSDWCFARFVLNSLRPRRYYSSLR